MSSCIAATANVPRHATTDWQLDIDRFRAILIIMAKWREQYDRTERWYDRFRTIDSGRAHDVSSDNYVDEIYAFFLNCYHLKDWIKNDTSLPDAVRSAVEHFIDSKRSLRLCADVCNGLKHLELKRDRSGEKPKFGRKQFDVGLGAGVPTTISVKCEITTETGTVDAFQLATEALESWKKFMMQHSLRH